MEVHKDLQAPRMRYKGLRCAQRALRPYSHAHKLTVQHARQPLTLHVKATTTIWADGPTARHNQRRGLVLAGGLWSCSRDVSYGAPNTPVDMEQAMCTWQRSGRGTWHSLASLPASRTQSPRRGGPSGSPARCHQTGIFLGLSVILLSMIFMSSPHFEIKGCHH